MKTYRTLFVTVVLLVAAVSSAHAQSSARPSPVEVVSPKPPTPITIEGKTTLIYELHITNFGPSDLTLKEIDVFGLSDAADAMSGTSLGAFKDAALQAMLRPVADMMTGPTENPGKLEIGKRVIAFLYVTLPEGTHVAALRHRFSFDVADPNRGKGTPNDESALDGVIVPVLQHAPLVLSPPLPSGTWLAGNGPSNGSVHRRSIMALNGKTYISQRFAIDWVKVGDNGNTFHDSREKNENFWAFAQAALAVADGEVTESVDTFPDNQPGKIPLVTVQNILGNHVILRIAPDVYALYAHLKQGSIRVRLHERVKRGQQIAQVGNSGNTTGSHLHFQLMDGNNALAAEGVPYLLEKFRFLGFGKDYEPDRHPDEPRSRTMPADGTVLVFP